MLFANDAPAILGVCIPIFALSIPIVAIISGNWRRAKVAEYRAITVQQMLDALARVAGPAVRARVRFEPDARIAAIVGNWPRAATAQRAAALGLVPEASFDDIIRQYIADSASTPGALQGLPA